MKYWMVLNQAIQAEPVHERDRMVMDMLKGIGLWLMTSITYVIQNLMYSLLRMVRTIDALRFIRYEHQCRTVERVSYHTNP